MAIYLIFVMLLQGSLLVNMVYSDEDKTQPNVILLNADDMGWGDLSSYGHPTQEWGPIDDLAKDGMRFTNMYAGAAICTPSRAALMTGRMPVRIGVYGPQIVFRWNSIHGLPREEITLAEALQDVGYTTGMVGKWHLGINAHNHTDGSHLPYNHGFDYVGHNIPLSNTWEADEEQIHMPKPDPLASFLYYNATNIQQPLSHKHLTESFVNDATVFIRSTSKKKQPFFLYYGLAQPHVVLFNNPGFVGSSKRGRYGDNIREMAWAVGAIVDEVERLNLEDNTIIIFVSDNGPHLELCSEAGDAGVFKGGKVQFWEGGIRVPGIVRWSGHIKPGSINNELVSQLDIMPTVIRLAAGRIPDDRVIDGQDISKSLLNWEDQSQPEPSNTKPSIEDKAENTRILAFYCADTLYAVRYGSYKFHYKSTRTRTKEEDGRDFCGTGGFPVNFYAVNCWPICDNPECTTTHDPPLMYNVDEDPNEAYPLDISLPKHKNFMDKMMVELAIFKSELTIGSSLMDNSMLSDDVTPCCTPESFPDCTCNYPPIDDNMEKVIPSGKSEL